MGREESGGVVMEERRRRNRRLAQSTFHTISFIIFLTVIGWIYLTMLHPPVALTDRIFGDDDNGTLLTIPASNDPCVLMNRNDDTNAGDLFRERTCQCWVRFIRHELVNMRYDEIVGAAIAANLCVETYLKRVIVYAVCILGVLFFLLLVVCVAYMCTHYKPRDYNDDNDEDHHHHIHRSVRATAKKRTAMMDKSTTTTSAEDEPLSPTPPALPSTPPPLGFNFMKLGYSNGSAAAGGNLYDKPKNPPIPCTVGMRTEMPAEYSNSYEATKFYRSIEKNDGSVEDATAAAKTLSYLQPPSSLSTTTQHQTSFVSLSIPIPTMIIVNETTLPPTPPVTPPAAAQLESEYVDMSLFRQRSVDDTAASTQRLLINVLPEKNSSSEGRDEVDDASPSWRQPSTATLLSSTVDGQQKEMEDADDRDYDDVHGLLLPPTTTTTPLA